MKNIFLLLFFIAANAVAQNQNSVWIFGDSAGIDFSNLNNPVPVFSGMDERGSCASIADTSGNLLFYCYSSIGGTDSLTLVYNYLNDTMSNGFYLIGSASYNQVVIVPIPNDSTKYFIFHLGFYNSTVGLFYSIVDMSLNGGQGEVIQKNIQLSTLMQGDCIEAIKHGNGRDWWLLSKLGGFGTTQIDRFYVYLISPGNTISTPIIQDFGHAVDAVQQKIVINSTADKLMNINTGGFMCEYNFDRCTGVVSSPNIIFPQQLSNFNRIFFQGAYSSNGNVFYVSRNSFGGNFGNKNYLLQYDLSAIDIPASCDTLDSTYTYPPVDNGAVRLAPDGKIYYSQAYISLTAVSTPYADTMRNYINENLGVINNPDITGSGCNFAPFSFYLGGKRTYYGLPNNPNYSLGPLAGSPCDTLSVGINEIGIKSNPELFVFYLTSWQKLFVNAQNIKGKNAVLQIFDLTGKMVYTNAREHPSGSRVSRGYVTMDVNCNSFSTGMYIVKLQTEKEKLTKKFFR